MEESIAQKYAKDLNRIFMGNDEYYASLQEYVESLGCRPGDWMPDVITDWHGEKQGVQLVMALGGPTVWLDTVNICVICPTDNSCAGTFRDICEEINMLFGI